MGSPPIGPHEQRPGPGTDHGRVFGWVSRKPKVAFFTTLFVALLVGIGIGAAGSTQQEELDKKDDQIAGLQSRLHDQQAARKLAESRLGTTETKLSTAKEHVKKLTAQGEVPDFTGGTVDDANTAAADYGWKIRTTREASDEEPGTVIAQVPSEGTQLNAGRSIQLTVASARPKQWVTVRTLSGSGGESKSDEFTIPSGRVRLEYNMPGEGNNAITLYKAPDEYVDLLVNDIGATSGQTRVYTPGTYYLDVTGDSYTVEVQHWQ